MTGPTNQAGRVPKRSVDGILLLDKPVGITSNRALQIAKRHFRAAKAGHTGSLDPLASGMLPLCFGQATKVSGFLLDADKEYEVEIAWGVRMDTGDADGTEVERCDLTEVDQATLETALAANRGSQMQVPPMYSALKQQGRRLYELARAGIEVERKPRPVEIHELSVVRFDARRPVVRVRCSKGTYVRSLVETIAGSAGTLGYVAALRRTMAGPFAGHPMVSLEALEDCAGDPEALDALLLPADAALRDYPAIYLNRDEAFYLRNGHAVGHADPGVEGLVRIYGPEEVFLGLGRVEPTGQIAPKRLFVGGAGAP